MAMQFDNNTDDSLYTSDRVGPGGDFNTGFFAFWFKMADLTGGQTVFKWSQLTLNASSVTSGELRLIGGCATTSWEAETSGLSLDTSTWRFLAGILISDNTSDQYDVHLWAGTAETAPQEITVTTQVTGVGNPNATSSSVRMFSNASTGSGGAMGLMDSVITIGGMSTANVTAGKHPWQFTPSTNPINSEAVEFMYRRYVLPTWRGEIHNGCRGHGGVTSAAPAADGVDFGDFSTYETALIYIIRQRNVTAGQPFVSTSNNGTVFSQERGPRGYNTANPSTMWRRR